MKSGKAPGLDGFSVECLKQRGTAVLEWLVSLLNVSFDVGVVPMGWWGACIYPCTKGKVKNVNVAKFWAGTECTIGEEQCGFRQGRGCMDQVFAVQQVCQN